MKKFIFLFLSLLLVLSLVSCASNATNDNPNNPQPNNEPGKNDDNSNLPAVAIPNVGLNPSSTSSSTETERWEYKLVSVHENEIGRDIDADGSWYATYYDTTVINQYGAEGWELVSFIDDKRGNAYWGFCFKRKLP